VALLLLYHEDFKKHTPHPYSHPESPARLERALGGLERFRVGAARIEEPPKGDPGVYAAVHSPTYLKSVLSMGGYGVTWLDADTYVSPGTREAVERLAGAAVRAVEEASRGGVAFILGRPPGHHAGVAGRALGAPTSGFCIVNTSALVARMLARDHGEPVVVFDFDLHHGNGTQEIFWDDPTVVHIDVHQDPATIYPGVGFPEDVGSGKGRGTKVNITTPPWAGDDIYMHALGVVEDMVREVSPRFIVFSAGFDAYRGDNDFTVMHVGSRFYWEAARRLARLARGVVAVLEGGYGSGLERGLPAFAAGLAGEPDPVADEERSSPASGWKFYARSLRRLKNALKSSGSPLWRAVSEPDSTPS
jgi:acetoin utilization deacetylase AcuC-like enzyme